MGPTSRDQRVSTRTAWVVPPHSFMEMPFFLPSFSSIVRCAFRSSRVSVARATSRHAHSLISPSFRSVRAPTGRQQLTAASPRAPSCRRRPPSPRAAPPARHEYPFLWDYMHRVLNSHYKQLIQKEDTCIRRRWETSLGHPPVMQSGQ